MLFLGGHLKGGEIKAFVTSNKVAKGEAVELFIKAQGKDIVFPTIDTIANVKIDNIAKHHSKHLTVGKNGTNVIQEETLVLSFFLDKNSTIEPLEVLVDNEKLTTQPIDIVVEAPHTSNQKVSLELMVPKRSFYENEAFVASVLFRRDKNLPVIETSYTPPKFDGFLSQEIGKQRQIDAGSSVATQVDYLLIPKQSGTFTLDKAKAKVALQTSYSMGDRLGIFFEQPKWIDIASNTLDIEIVPLDVPATLVGDFTITATVDKNSTKANEPVTLTLTLKGNGVIDTIDTTPYNIDNATLYDQPPVYKQRLNKSNLEVSYSQKFVFMASEDFTIPPLEIDVFSPTHKKHSTLLAPSFDIEVQNANTVAPQENPKLPRETSLSPMFIVAIFLAGMGGGAFLFWITTKIETKRKRKKHHHDALMKLYPYVREDDEVERIVRQLYGKQKGAKGSLVDKKTLKDIIERYAHKTS